MNVFWDSDGGILTDFMEKGTTINFTHCVETVKKRISRFYGYKASHKCSNARSS
jgi:hypothetical protein